MKCKVQDACAGVETERENDTIEDMSYANPVMADSTVKRDILQHL